MVSTLIRGKKSQFYLISAIVIVLSLSVIAGLFRLPEEITVSQMPTNERAPLAFKKSLDYLKRTNLKTIAEWGSLAKDHRKKITVKENDNATLNTLSFNLDFPDNIDPNSIKILEGNREIPYILEWIDREEKSSRIFIRDEIRSFQETNYEVFANIMEPGELSYPPDTRKELNYLNLDLTSIFNTNNGSSECSEPSYTGWETGEIVEGGISFELFPDTLALDKCNDLPNKQEIKVNSTFTVDELHLVLASSLASCENRTTLQVEYKGSFRNYSIVIPGYEQECDSSVPYIQPLGTTDPGENIYHTIEDIRDGNISSLTFYQNGSIKLAAITLEGRDIPRVVDYKGRSYQASSDQDREGMIEDLKVFRGGQDIAKSFFKIISQEIESLNYSVSPTRLKEKAKSKIFGFQSDLPSALIKGEHFFFPNLIKSEYTIDYKPTLDNTMVGFKLNCEEDYTIESGETTLQDFCQGNTQEVVNNDFFSLYTGNYSVSFYTNSSSWEFRNSTQTVSPEVDLIFDSSSGAIYFNTSTSMNASELYLEIFLQFHEGGKSYAKEDRRESYASPGIEKSSSTLKTELKNKQDFLDYVYSRRGYTLNIKTHSLGFKPLKKGFSKEWEIDRNYQLPLKIHNPLNFHTTDWIFNAPLEINGRLNSLAVGNFLPYQLVQEEGSSELDLDIKPPINYSVFSIRPFNISLDLSSAPSNLTLTVYRYGEKVNEISLTDKIYNFSKGTYTFKIKNTTNSHPFVEKFNSTSPRLVLNQDSFEITNGWTGEFYVFLPEDENLINVKLGSGTANVFLRDTTGKILERAIQFSGEEWLKYSVENWRGGRYFILDVDRNSDRVSFDFDNLRNPSKNQKTFFQPSNPEVGLLFENSLYNNQIRKAGVYFDNGIYKETNFDTELEVDSSNLELNNSFYSLGFEQDFKWGYRINLTIDSSKISSDLKNFPVLINLTSNNFNFNKAQADGDDIRITDSNNRLLDYEIEQWTGTPQAQIWVEVPEISSSEDTLLHLYYNNSEAEDAQDPDGVWDGTYTMVQHLEESCSSKNCLKDSTLNENDVTPYDGQTLTNIHTSSGMIEGAATFDGEKDDYLNTSLESWISGREKLSITGWFNATWDSGDQARIYGSDNNVSELYQDGSSLVAKITSSGTDYEISSSSLNSNQWYHFAVTFNSSGMEFYINGSSQGSESFDGQIDDLGSFFKIGFREDIFEAFGGVVDEFRVSNKARSQAWISASYRNGEGNLVTYSEGESLNSSDVNNKHLVINLSGRSWLKSPGIHATVSKLYGDKDGAFTAFENISFKEKGPLRAEIQGEAANLPGVNYTLYSYSSLPLIRVDVNAEAVPYDLTLKNQISTGGDDENYSYEGDPAEYGLPGSIDLTDLECPGLTWVGKRDQGGNSTVGVVFNCDELYPSERTVLLKNESISISFSSNSFTYYILALKDEEDYKELERFSERLEHISVKKEILYTKFNMETPRLRAGQKLIT